MLITHLLFADDTLVFCGASKDQMMYLKWILLLFEALSGLQINLEKSSIIPVGDVENLEMLAQELDCNISTLPTSYLGLPLAVKHKSLAVWDKVEEKFHKRLALWKK